MKREVCEYCASRLLPNGCEGCLAALAYEVAEERLWEIRRREEPYIGETFREKFQKELCQRKKRGRA